MTILMNELTDKIERWAIQRNLHTADPTKQILKLGEEYGELCRAFNKGQEDEMKDAIGDMYVVMTNFCKQKGYSIESCVHAAYNEIKNRKGKMVNGVFVKD